MVTLFSNFLPVGTVASIFHEEFNFSQGKLSQLYIFLWHFSLLALFPFIFVGLYSV